MSPINGRAGAAPKGKDGKLDHNRALTGDDLRDFVNGKLFPYLHGFKQKASGPNTIEYKIGEIFGEIKNKIQSGYNLREIIDHIDELRFRSQSEKHELSHLYEAKIRNMGNAGRNGGEYYTPRPLIRAIVQVVKPRIGERIYDGVVGSAGFLCESFEYLTAKPGLTTKDVKTLQGSTFFGKEKKSLAYVIAIMNMILHGIEAPTSSTPTRLRKPRRHPGKRPLRRGDGQSAFRRQGTQGGAAELPQPREYAVDSRCPSAA
jgi:type I restriction enzyme M protein